MNPKQKEAFEGLKKKYLDALPEKIGNIKKTIALNDLHLLQQEFHKIKGSGKTYGFEDISLVAIEIDKHCKAKNPKSFNLAEKACLLLQKIYDKQISKEIYELINDPLFKEIQ